MHSPRATTRPTKRNCVTLLLGLYAVLVTGVLYWQLAIQAHSQPKPGAVVMPLEIMTPAPATTRPTVKRERHLVVSHYKENLTWLHEGWGAASSHTIYEMARQPGVLPDFSTNYAQDIGKNRFALLNFADEGSGYLRFILDNYDNLPDVTVFVHGTPEGHNKHIGEWVNCIKPGVGDERHFLFLTKRHVKNRCIIDAEGNSLLKRFKHGPRQGEEIDYGAFVAYWKTFPWRLLHEDLTSPPLCVSFHCCAEFAATRAMIRSRPREFYATIWAHLLDFILDEKIAKTYHGMQTRSAGGILEHIWHLIFHEEVHMQRTTPERYCELLLPQCGACKLDTVKQEAEMSGQDVIEGV